jgi:hypothetical protein
MFRVETEKSEPGWAGLSLLLIQTSSGVKSGVMEIMWQALTRRGVSVMAGVWVVAFFENSVLRDRLS